eukprot:441842_1
MATLWIIKVFAALFICGCFIGGALLELELIKLFEWTFQHEDDCLNDFDFSWTNFGYVVAWMIIGWTILFFFVVIISNETVLITSVSAFFCVYVILILMDGFTTGLVTDGYLFDDDCDILYNDILGFTIGQTILTLFGFFGVMYLLCGLCMGNM